MITDEPSDAEYHSEYQGEEIYFCCRKCVRKFEADPAAYVANLPMQASTEEMAGTDHHEQGEDHEHPSEGPSGEAEVHDHAAHGESSSKGGPLAWISWLGRLHPMWVHFPIALLLLAALAEILFIRTGDERVAFTARFSLWAGAIGALVAAPLGWADALGAEDYTGISEQLLFYHRWVGTSTAALALLALVSCERWHRGGSTSALRLYRISLFLGSLLVMFTGHLGASLVFGWDYLSR